MRHLFSVLLIISLSFKLMAQSNGPIISVLPYTVNVGEIHLSELNANHGKVLVEVLNTGKQPLILTEVTGCCGTTVKEKPNAPILPGKKGVIKVEFRIDARPQVISRSVTIKSNAVNIKQIKVPIVGVVIADKQSNEIVL